MAQIPVQPDGSLTIQIACPADTALGQADVTYDFTSGASNQFSASGTVTYDDTNGATFTVAKKGDGPLIQSGWYIMFGKVEYTIKAAPGTGIVSSAVLQSDDLDEIDWEWLGGKSSQVQTNYFGKGDTSSYNRGAFHSNPDNQAEWHTYSVDWTSQEIVWAIDGVTVRALTPATADTNQYPQSPMMIKVGVWAGGDSDNAQGTIGKPIISNSCGRNDANVSSRLGWWCDRLQPRSFQHVHEEASCDRLLDRQVI